MKTISKASTWAKLLYEFLGTAVMTYSYNASLDKSTANVRSRPFAFFLMWIIAFKVSGAHFNPATSFAVFQAERKMSNLLGFGMTFLAQVCGAYLGIALSYLLIKDYLENYYLLFDA